MGGRGSRPTLRVTLRAMAAAAVVAGSASISMPAHAAIDNVLQVDVLSTSLSPLARWRDLIVRHQGQVASSEAWGELVAAISGVAPGNLLNEVNRLINRVDYVADNGDAWATPTEFLRRGGDCEDYAIAKYLLLRQSGVPASAMRIVIMRPPNSEPHAILLVETTGGTYALDNLRATPYSFSPRAAATVVYAFNEQSMWLPTGSLRLVAQR